MRTRFSGLLALTVVLAACGQPTTGSSGGGGKYTPPPAGQPLNTNTNGSFSVKGNVTFSGALSATSAPSISPQQALAQSDWNAPHVPGALLVRADLNTFRAQAAGALAGLNAQSVGDGLTLVQTGSGDEQALAARLAVAGYVTQPNYIYKLQAVVNDPGWPENDGINIGGTLYDQDYLTRINVADAWNVLGQKNAALRSGVKVAVLDTGVNANHPDLAGHVLTGRNFSSNLPDGTADTSDDSGNAHGTSTAGLIAASTNNGVGIAGVTWGGQILPVKVFDANGSATTAALTAGVNYAVKQGARVINMSLGFVGQADPDLAKAIQDAKTQGRVVVAAAGNTPNDGLYYPGSDPNVITVGATYQPDPQNQPSTEAVTCYSAQPKAGQKAVDIYAPGGPGGKLDTSGRNVTPCGDQNYNILSLGPNNGYQLITGTSEAAPQVSGAVSLMLAANSTLTVDQVRNILVSSGRSFAGGKFLDVGAAVRQALGVGGSGGNPTPPPANASYYVTLAVSQNGGLIGQGTGTVDAGATGLPFEASLAAGTYTFQAKVFKNGAQIQSGQTTVKVPDDTNGKSITVATK